MGKNLIKQTAVAVLLTTSVLSYAPIAFGATTSVDQSVNKLKTELSKATTHYVYPALDGKLVPSSALYQTLNSAKKNYQLTKNIIVSSKLSSKQKKAKLDEIDALYNEKISGGLVPYIDAYNYAIKYLVPIMNEIKEAEANNDFAAVESGYHKLSYQLKGRSAILYRFSGKAARDLLLDQYKITADEKRYELMVPVTISMKLTEITDLLSSNKTVDAQAKFAEVEELLVRLPEASTNDFVGALLDEVKSVEESVKEGDISPQKVLDTKVASLVSLLNTVQGDIATASMNRSNELTVTINEDVNPGDFSEFLGNGFYSNFVNILGVTKINGYQPASEEAIISLISAFPSGVETLADLKGSTVSLPITVNNGTPLNVEFKINFK